MLVVEDDPRSRELTRVSSSPRLKVIEAGERPRGLAWLVAAIRRRRMILLDLMMPEMDGFALLDAIEKNPEWQRHPGRHRDGKDLTATERESAGQAGSAR